MALLLGIDDASDDAVTRRNAVRTVIYVTPDACVRTLRQRHWPYRERTCQPSHHPRRHHRGPRFGQDSANPPINEAKQLDDTHAKAWL